MNNKLLEVGKDYTIDALVSRVNDVIGEKFSVLREYDDIEKWNSIPKLFLLDDVVLDKILSFVTYMDTLLIQVEKKAMYVISLSGLIEFTKIMITDYDDGDLFLLADYYEDKNIAEIKSTFDLVSNKNLLSAIRNKTLDLEIRKKLLLDFINQINSGKINSAKAEELSSVISEYIKKIENTDCSDLVN